MLIAFFILAAALFAVYMLSKDKYGEYTGLAGDKLFRLKALLPAGLFIMELLGCKYSTGYDRKLLAAIIETAGPKQAHACLRLHWANKTVLMLSGLLLIIFIGSFTVPDAGFGLFAGAVAAGAFYMPDWELFDRVKARRRAIRLDFPDFVNKLVLLINAGMTITKAWERVAADSKKDTPLYREVCMAVQDIKAGKPEHSAYEEFAKRCRTPEITRFISVILQNLRKGNAEIVPILRVLTNDCWEMRKNTAKRLGEEASTKMLLPLMLMFLAILLIVGTPAVLALRSI